MNRINQTFNYFQAKELTVCAKRADFDPGMGYTVYDFPRMQLAFVDSDEFSELEREIAYQAYCKAVQPRVLKEQAYVIAQQRVPEMFPAVAESMGLEFGDEEIRQGIIDMYTGAVASGIEIGLELAAQMAEADSRLDDQEGDDDEDVSSSIVIPD